MMGIVFVAAFATTAEDVLLVAITATLGRLEIDHQFERGRLFNRKISRRHPTQNLVDVIGGAPKEIRVAGPYDIRPPASTGSRKP